METPTLSPAGVGAPTKPPPAQDISTMTDMVAELTRPVDRAQLDREIEDFNLSFPVNVDDALEAFTLPPVAGTGTAPTTTAPLATSTPITTMAPPPITTTARPRRPRSVTWTCTRPATTATTTTAPSRPSTVCRSAGTGTRTTTSTLTTPTGRPTVAAKQP